MSAALEGGAFQYVRASSRRKHTKQNRQPDRLLQKCLRELKDGDWLRACKQLVRDSPRWTHNESNHVLCLGLGSPTYSLTAAAQLAFLLQLCDDMCLPYSRISAYDPAFSEDDNKLLDELKIHRVTENLEGKHAITSPTLVFMPHCDVQLYEALLAANWTHERLTNMLLVCNQFSQYQTSIPRRIFEAKYPHLLRYASHCESTLLPDCQDHWDAFISIAVQFVPSQRLSSLIQDTEPPEAKPLDESPPTDA